MPYRNMLVLLIFSLATLQPCNADAPEGYPFVAFDKGLQLAQTENKPIFLYFGRYGCTWCDMTNKRAFIDPEVRKRYTEHYILVYVDTESGKRLKLPSGERITEAELGIRLKVYATPLFAFIDPKGKAMGSTAGAKKIEDLLAMDRYIVEQHYHKMTLSEFLRNQ